MSRDGARLVFSSNSGLPRYAEFPGRYTDAYLIDLAAAVLTTAGSSSPVGIRLEQNAAAVTYSGSWHSNAIVVP